jgi:hypothetical protein
VGADQQSKQFVPVGGTGGVSLGIGVLVLVGAVVEVGPEVAVREGVRVGARVAEGPIVGVRLGVGLGGWAAEMVRDLVQVTDPGNSNVSVRV